MCRMLRMRGSLPSRHIAEMVEGLIRSIPAASSAVSSSSVMSCHRAVARAGIPSASDLSPD